MKKGVELEYFTVDSEGCLIDNEDFAERFDFADPEFAECILEIKSEPCDTVKELKEDLCQKTREVVEEADEEGMKLVPLGTPLKHDGAELIESERLQMMKKFNPRDIEIEKELLRVGTHIHFEKDNVRDQLNIMTALDPAFALLNASPYHDGDRAASSSRNWIYRYGWEPDFPQTVELWDYADSVEGWKQRMHEAFEGFRQGAIDAGIEPEKFDSHFHPDRSTWTPVRLRDQFPTVEYRSPDATSPGDVLRFVSDMETVMKASKDREVAIGENPGIRDDVVMIPEFERLEELSRLAAREGISNPEVRNYLSNMGFSADEYEPLSEKIGKKEKISLEEARQMRLEAAEILEEDLEELNSVETF